MSQDKFRSQNKSRSDLIVSLHLKDSLTVIRNAYVDVSVRGAEVYSRFQFERNGFFSVDPDSKPGKVRSPLETSLLMCEIGFIYRL